MALIIFSKLPGVGKKTAQRLVFHLLKRPEEEVKALADSLVLLTERVRHCSECFNITEADPCDVCASESRQRNIVCVVEEANDVLAIERTNEFRGLYHVLGGALSPLDGIGPESLRIRELVSRMKGDVEEVILATNANAEGEATAVYIAKLLKPLGMKLSRIARGVPMGGDLEYTDEVTLARAISGRVEF